MNRGRLAGIAVHLTLLAMVMSPVLATGRFPCTHDKERYPLLLVEFREAISQGVWYPRWVPDAIGGYGAPTFVFYQPLFFFVAAPLASLPGCGPCEAVLLAAALFAAIGLRGAGRLAALLGAPGWVGAAVFALTPYLYVDLYVRGDLTELASLLLTPWPLVEMLRLRSTIGTGATGEASLLTGEASLLAGKASLLAGKASLLAGKASLLGGVAPALRLAAWLSLLVWAHPMTAFLFWPVCAILGLALARELPGVGRRPFLALGAGSFALAAGMSAFYWLPVVDLLPHIRVEEATSGYFVASQHVVQPRQLLERAWDFGVSSTTSSGGPDGMSFQLGLFHVLLAAFGAWRGRRRPLLLAGAVLYLAGVGLMLPVSARLWEEVGPLRKLQFPWRVLSATASLQLLLALGAFHGGAEVRTRWIVLALLAGVVWHGNQFRIVSGDRDALAAMDRFVEERASRLAWRIDFLATTAETCPRTATTFPSPPRRDGPLCTVVGSATTACTASGTPHRIHAEWTSDGPCEIALQQFWFPGWEVDVDGERVPDDVLRAGILPDGRMRLSLPPARRGRIDARYAGPPGLGRRLAVAVAGVLAFLAAVALRGPRAEISRDPDQV